MSNGPFPGSTMTFQAGANMVSTSCSETLPFRLSVRLNMLNCEPFAILQHGKPSPSPIAWIDFIDDDECRLIRGLLSTPHSS